MKSLSKRNPNYSQKKYKFLSQILSVVTTMSHKQAQKDYNSFV